jgi:hypothetical protein
MFAHMPNVFKNAIAATLSAMNRSFQVARPWIFSPWLALNCTLLILTIKSTWHKNLPWGLFVSAPVTTHSCLLNLASKPFAVKLLFCIVCRFSFPLRIDWGRT